MFTKERWCHAASANRDRPKHSIYLYKTKDAEAEFLAPGYFNEAIVDLQLHDLIFLGQFDPNNDTIFTLYKLVVTGRTTTNVTVQIMNESSVQELDALVVHKAGAEDITGAKTFFEPVNITGGLVDTNVATPINLGDSGNTSPNTGNKTLIGAINELEQKTSGGGAAPLPVYMTNTASAILGTYNQLSYMLPPSQNILSAVTNNNEVLIKTFLFDAPVATTVAPAGLWSFSLYGYVSSATNVTTIRAEVFARAAGGTETTLFSATSQEINITSVGLIHFDSFQNSFTVNATDYIGVRIYAATNAVVNRTVFLYLGNGSPSYFTTPFALRHDLLRDIKYVSSNQSGALHMTNGAETLYGVKTFNSSPEVPTPTTTTQASNKGYSDSGISRIATCSTAAATAAKTVSIPGLVIAPGTTIKVFFQNGNSATTPTLNVNSTSNDPIYDERMNPVGSVDRFLPRVNTTVEFYRNAANTYWIYVNRVVSSSRPAGGIATIWCNGFIEQDYIASGAARTGSGAITLTGTTNLFAMQTVDYDVQITMRTAGAYFSTIAYKGTALSTTDILAEAYCDAPAEAAVGAQTYTINVRGW